MVEKEHHTKPQLTLKKNKTTLDLVKETTTRKPPNRPPHQRSVNALAAKHHILHAPGNKLNYCRVE
jgi:hypothetical protein